MAIAIVSTRASSPLDRSYGCRVVAKVSTWAERLHMGSAALVNLAAKILGISMLKKTCIRGLQEVK